MVAFANKLVGWSFGLDERVSLATGLMRFGIDEGSRSVSVCGSSSRSSIPVKDMEKVNLLGLDLNSEQGGTVQGNGIGFSLVNGSLSGIADGVNVNEKEGEVSRNFIVNGRSKIGVASGIKEEDKRRGDDISHTHQKKETLKKTEPLKGDPDWLPEPGRRANSVCKRRKQKRGQTRNNPLEEHEGKNFLKPIIQALPAPNSIKDIFLSSGWKIVSQEGVSNPIYVSPSGSVYKSLVKALEAFSHDAFKFSSSQSADNHFAEKSHKKKAVQWRANSVKGPVDPVILDNTVVQKDLCKENEHASPSKPVEVRSTIAQKEVVFSISKNTRISCIEDECMSGEIQKSDLSSVEVTDNSENCDSDTHQVDKFLGVGRSVCISGKDVSVYCKLDMEMGNGEEDSNCGFLLTGDVLPRKPETQEGEGKEALRMATERGQQVNEVAVEDEKLKYCMKDECLNSENNDSDCCTVVVNNNVQDSNCDIDQAGELQGVRRSVRINGRHVPVHSELDVEICDSDYYFDSSNSLDFLTLENNKDASSMPEKVRFREVHEVLASCMAKEKAKNSISVNKLTQDMPVLKHELDKDNCKENSPIPEEVICREVHGVATSFITDEEGKSCAKDDYLSDETKKPDWSSMMAAKNDQNKGNDMPQEGEFVGVRRSTRINGRHVPVEREMDIEMCSVDEYINSYNFVVNRVANKHKETEVVSKVGNESPAKGNMLWNQTSTKEFDYQEPQNKQQLERKSISYREGTLLKEFAKKKTPASKKYSLSSKKNGAKALMTKKHSPSSASKRKSVRGGCYGNKKKKRSGGCSLKVRTGKKSDYDENILSETKISILSWLIDTGTVSENEKVIYKIKNGKGNILRGSVNRGGIRCNCCKKVLSLSEFEAHAGSNLFQPWNNTCLTSGKSLMQCQIEAWEKEMKQIKIGFQMVGVDDADPSDDTCGICADGGHLICCDGCPSTFHQDCVMLKSLPEGSWYCPFCRCAFCLLVDRGQDTSSGTMKLLSCNQCGCKYHMDCVCENSMDKMGMGTSSYCGNNCEKVASGLSKMLGVPNPIGGSFSWTLLRRTDEEEAISSDIKRSFIMESNVKLPLAFLVLHECFVPLVDPRTGLDMIAQAVYSCGSNFNRLHYEGFLTVILEKDETIISVATLRLHGTRVAEMPFIGTRPIYRRQGMCRRLLNAIEEMLFSLSVETLIIPAVPDMLETWMRSFSFKQLDSSHRDEIRNLNMMIFAETTLLQKSICNKKK